MSLHQEVKKIIFVFNWTFINFITKSVETEQLMGSFEQYIILV